MKELVGKVGRYEVYGHLASRLTGELYAAREAARAPSARNLFALTVLPERDSAPRALPHLRSALRRHSTFVNSGFAQHFDVFAHEGRLIVAQEFVRGVTLSRVIPVIERLEAPLFAVSITTAVARLLHAAHVYEDDNVEASAIVHGDLCPSNISVTYEGSLVLLDTGLSAALSRLVPERAGVRGHLTHLAPERAANKVPVGPATDVYNLGLLLYELLAGGPAMEGKADGELIARAIRGDVPPLSTRVRVGEALTRLVDRALELDTAHRIGAAQLADQLGRLRSARSSGWNLEEQLRNLMARHFSHRAHAQKTLEERWMTRARSEARPRPPTDAASRAAPLDRGRSTPGDAPRAEPRRPSMGDLPRLEPRRPSVGELPDAERRRAPTGDLPRVVTGEPLHERADDRAVRSGAGPKSPIPAAIAARLGPPLEPRSLGAPDVAARLPIPLPVTVVSRPQAEPSPFVDDAVLAGLAHSADEDVRTDDLPREASSPQLRARPPLSFVRGVLWCLVVTAVLTVSTLWWPATWTAASVALGRGLVDAIQALLATIAPG